MPLPPGKTEQTFKLPAPLKGMNTVDGLASMSPDYCIFATNFIASQQGLTIREGYQKYSTGFTLPVTSLIPYYGRSAASNKLFAVSGGSIYDATTGGAIGAAVVTGLTSTSAYWQHSSQSTTSSKNYTMCVNGTDAPRLYDGSTWTTCTQSATPSGPGQFSLTDQDTGTVNIDSFIDVTLHAQRWWFVGTSTTIAYYLPIQAVGGQLYAFDFGPDFKRGGFLHKLASWTVDTGFGITYILVAISSRGDVVLYEGNDPSQSATWIIVGQYQLGTPVGQRCTFPLYNDIAYLSTDGLYPISKYIQSPRVDITSALTYLITPTIQDLINQWGATAGWEMIIHPLQKVLLLNVPRGAQSQNTQFCYNETNMGWTQFTNWPAQCFAMFEDELYFGGDTFVGQAFNGYTDGSSTSGGGGTSVTALALQAFSDLEYQGQKKITGVKPYVLSGQSNPSISVAINVDFNPNLILTTSTPSAPTGSMIWGSMTWGTMVWGGSQIPVYQWFTPASSPGEYIAVGTSMQATSTTTWIATEFMMKPGSSFG